MSALDSYSGLVLAAERHAGQWPDAGVFASSNPGIDEAQFHEIGLAPLVFLPKSSLSLASVGPSYSSTPPDVAASLLVDTHKRWPLASISELKTSLL